MAKNMQVEEVYIVLPNSGVVAAETTWFEDGINKSLHDTSGQHGMLLKAEVTFADVSYDGEVQVYTTDAFAGYSTTAPSTDVTSTTQATPIGVITPVQNTVVTDFFKIPVEFNDYTGIMIKNTDTTQSVTVVLSFKYVTL